METQKVAPESNLSYFYPISPSAICRICLEKVSNVKTMCNIFEGTDPLYNMIVACASVQILQGDGLPNSICQTCVNNLNLAWQFRIQCETSDLKLRQYYCNPNIFQHYVQTSSDYEERQKSYELEHEIEHIETAPLDNIKNDDSKNVISARNKTKIRKANASNEAKIHQCDTCGKTFNRREYLTQHIRIHTGEKPYFCHICEKRFVNSGHLTTHMRTHTGEKPHACNLCPKAFSTKQELHKHTMVHKGERPFICTTCGKSFGSSSNLYSHIKHHTGEKNFTCEHCGKAFYTKQELKQHFVVHTGEKAYACKFCSKRFSQNAHLKRHLKLHT